VIERMHPDDLEVLADLVADRLAERLAPAPAAAGHLADVKTVAAVLGVSADFVRENAVELGGFRISESARAPWRFDVAVARERMAVRAASERSRRRAIPDRETPRRPASRRQARAAGQVLAIRGGDG
jgi:hypothetical protein